MSTTTKTTRYRATKKEGIVIIIIIIILFSIWVISRHDFNPRLKGNKPIFSFRFNLIAFTSHLPFQRGYIHSQFTFEWEEESAFVVFNTYIQNADPRLDWMFSLRILCVNHWCLALRSNSKHFCHVHLAENPRLTSPKCKSISRSKSSQIETAMMRAAFAAASSQCRSYLNENKNNKQTRNWCW